MVYSVDQKEFQGLEVTDLMVSTNRHRNHFSKGMFKR